MLTTYVMLMQAFNVLRHAPGEDLLSVAQVRSPWRMPLRVASGRSTRSTASQRSASGSQEDLADGSLSSIQGRSRGGRTSSEMMWSAVAAITPGRERASAVAARSVSPPGSSQLAAPGIPHGGGNQVITVGSLRPVRDSISARPVAIPTRGCITSAVSRACFCGSGSKASR